MEQRPGTARHDLSRLKNPKPLILEAHGVPRLEMPCKAAALFLIPSPIAFESGSENGFKSS
jgi:hypothetical protein